MLNFFVLFFPPDSYMFAMLQDKLLQLLTITWYIGFHDFRKFETFSSHRNAPYNTLWDPYPYPKGNGAKGLGSMLPPAYSTTTPNLFVEP